MKSGKFFYILVILAIVVIVYLGWYLYSNTGMMRCGPCGCLNDQCGGGISWKLLYSSSNLQGHSIAAECNPGNGTNCSCLDEDASLVSNSNYGEVIANPFHKNTWVNAIGYKKFIESFPDGSKIKLDVYKYTALTRMPTLPSPNDNQQQNPQAVHLMMQLYDGRNEFGRGSKNSLEATVFWELNPWTEAGRSGKISLYTPDPNNPKVPILSDTGFQIKDTNWHNITLEADFSAEKYISITVDGNKKYINVPLLKLNKPDWNSSISFSITTESEPSWPRQNCEKIFYWNQYFKDIKFYKRVV